MIDVGLMRGVFEDNEDRMDSYRRKLQVEDRIFYVPFV